MKRVEFEENAIEIDTLCTTHLVAIDSRWKASLPTSHSPPIRRRLVTQQASPPRTTRRRQRRHMRPIRHEIGHIHVHLVLSLDRVDPEAPQLVLEILAALLQRDHVVVEHLDVVHASSEDGSFVRLGAGRLAGAYVRDELGREEVAQLLDLHVDGIATAAFHGVVGFSSAPL